MFMRAAVVVLALIVMEAALPSAQTTALAQACPNGHCPPK